MSVYRGRVRLAVASLVATVGVAVGSGAVGGAVAHAAGDPLWIVHASGAAQTRALEPSTGTRYLVAPCWDARGRLVTVAEDAPAIVERRATLTSRPQRIRQLAGMIDGRLAPGCGRAAETHMVGKGMDVLLEGRRVYRSPRAYWEARPVFAWSADGSTLLIADRDRGRIVIVDAGSRRVVRTIRATGRFVRPEITSQALSPDGSRVVWTEHDTGGVDPTVRLLDVATGKVTTLEVSAYAASFDPAGTRLALTEGRMLTVIDLDTSARTIVARGSIQSPAWSPDGTRIAYVGLDARGVSERIEVISAAGGARSSVRYTKRNWALHEPTWSPDGTLLGFTGFSLVD